MGTKLIFLMISIASASVIAVGYLSYQVGREIINNQIEQVLTVQTERTLESINNLIFDRLNDMQLLIGDSVLNDKTASLDNKLEILRSKLTNLGWYEEFHLTDPDGIVITSTHKDSINTDFSNETWYRETLREFINVSDIEKSPSSGKNVLIFSNTIQNDSNEIIGYLVAEFSINIIQDLLKNTPENFESYLISKEGIVLAYQGPPIAENSSISNARIYQKPGSHLQKSIESEGLFSFDGNKWQVAVQIPTSIAYEPINSFTILLTIFSILIVLLVMILGHFSSKQFVKPILLLTEGVTQVRQGDFKQKIPIGSRDEVGYLAKSFNAMSLEIDQKTNNLIEEKGKYKTILESANEAIILFDTKNKAIAFNKEFEDLFLKKRKRKNLKKAENVLSIIDKKNVDVESKKAAELLQKLIKDNDLKKQVSLELTFKKPLYAIVALYTKPVIGEDGTLLGRIWVFNNITQEVESERSKHQFIHVASHKLRTPITTVNWNSQILLDGTFGEISEDQKETIKQIKGASEHLNVLSNILINVAEIKNEKIAIKKEIFELISLIDQAKEMAEKRAEILDNLRVKISKKNIKGIKVKGDAKKLKNVMETLIDNGTRYIKPDKNQKLELLVTVDKKSKRAIIEVRDNGLGIKESEEKKVFTKFFRSENADLSYPDGTGLSLYLAKIIIKSSGEKIWFESKEGKGASFFFTIKLA